jgi:DNA-binding Lrp family transcriptional regulator
MSKPAAAKPEETLVETMHPIDLKILGLLQKDCRLSFNKIALRAGVSVGTAYNRIKNLEKTGVVKGYSVILDSVKLGYGLTAIILVQAEGGFMEEVEKEISGFSGVVSVYDVTGDYDAAIIAKFKDRTDLNSFIKHLSATPHVRRTMTSIALNIVKEDPRVCLP